MAKKNEKWNEFCEGVWQRFVADAGWGNTPEERKEEMVRIEDKIQEHLVAIEKLKTEISSFDNRDVAAKEFIFNGATLLGETATEAAVLALTKTRFGVKKWSKRAPKVESADVETVINVLDGDGMRMGPIIKAIEEAGGSLDSKQVAKVLQKLIADKRVGSEGTGRSKEYFLYDTEEEASA